MSLVRPAKPAEPLLDEQGLVQRAKSGDADAFGRLYDAYIDAIYRYVFFRLSDQQIAEDLTSEVFLKAWENLRRYQPTRPFVAWLYVIARNTVIDYYRTRKQTISLDEVASVIGQEARLDAQLDLESDVKSLNEALQQLTDEQREVLVLKFIADLDTDEIARQMRKNEGAIRALQMRALRAMARAMAKDGR